MAERMTDEEFAALESFASDLHPDDPTHRLLAEARRAREREAALEAKCALLASSLKKADADVEGLRSALRCPGDDAYGGIHRCARCDAEVAP